MCACAKKFVAHTFNIQIIFKYKEKFNGGKSQFPLNLKSSGILETVVMKEWDDRFAPQGKQMRSLWAISLTPPNEKRYGKHPTQKPVELLKRIIESSSNEGDWVLDPFNGSGTTVVVAKMLGRKYIGIDKEKEFLDLTVKRMSN